MASSCPLQLRTSAAVAWSAQRRSPMSRASNESSSCPISAAERQAQAERLLTLPAAAAAPILRGIERRTQPHQPTPEVRP